MTDGEPRRVDTPSLQEMYKKGKALRSSLRRDAHADLSLPDRDPVQIIAAQNARRLPDLVPVRIGRMLQSPFSYYRGTAAVMAHDLTAGPVTGQRVVCCGDAHISNFGLFASPERRLLFDLNDFDEVSTAPWEWDVKRLVASVVIGGRDIGLSDAACCESAVGAAAAYRETLRNLFARTALERYFFQVETDRARRDGDSGPAQDSEPHGQEGPSPHVRPGAGQAGGGRRPRSAQDQGGSADRAARGLPEPRRTARAVRPVLQHDAARHRVAAVAVPARRLHPARGRGGIGRHPLPGSAVRRTWRRAAVPSGQGGSAVRARNPRPGTSGYRESSCPSCRRANGS